MNTNSLETKEIKKEQITIVQTLRRIVKDEKELLAILIVLLGAIISISVYVYYQGFYSVFGIEDKWINVGDKSIYYRLVYPLCIAVLLLIPNTLTTLPFILKRKLLIQIWYLLLLYISSWEILVLICFNVIEIWGIVCIEVIKLTLLCISLGHKEKKLPLIIWTIPLLIFPVIIIFCDVGIRDWKYFWSLLIVPYVMYCLPLPFVTFSKPIKKNQKIESAEEKKENNEKNNENDKDNGNSKKNNLNLNQSNARADKSGKRQPEKNKDNKNINGGKAKKDVVSDNTNNLDVKHPSYNNATFIIALICCILFLALFEILLYSKGTSDAMNQKTFKTILLDEEVLYNNVFDTKNTEGSLDNEANSLDNNMSSDQAGSDNEMINNYPPYFRVSSVDNKKYRAVNAYIIIASDDDNSIAVNAYIDNNNVYLFTNEQRIVENKDILTYKMTYNNVNLE